MIEILVALVILGVSLLALAGLMGVVTRNNSFGNHLTEATTLAQDRLEELRVSKWDDISAGLDSIRTSSGINYRRSWTLLSGSPSNLRTVQITISWNGGANSIQMVSALAQPY